jgi:hypothetical protein
MQAAPTDQQATREPAAAILAATRMPARPSGNKADRMNARIEGNKLIVEIDMQKPTPSSTGKTLVVASSQGGKPTAAVVDGKPVTVNLSAWIK